MTMKFYIQNIKMIYLSHGTCTNIFFSCILEMWYQIFLWCLATSVFIHCISASVAFLALRKHSRGVFLPLLVIFIGFLYPVTGGVITSE